MMDWVKLVEKVSELLTSHARSVVLILALLLVGVLAHGFGVIEATPDSEIGTFIWLYFTVTVISLGVVAWVLFLMGRSDE